MKYRWPSDPPGKPASHSISWQTHQQNLHPQSGLPPIGNVGQNPQEAVQSVFGAPAAPPFDAGLEAARSAGTQRRTNLLSDLDVDAQQTSQEYGFKFNPATGAFGGFDPTNPFSQAALLMESRKNRDRGENTSFAATGQLYSGAYKTAQTETGHQYDKGYDALRRQFEDYVKRYLRSKRDIGSTPIEELANL